MLKRCTVVLVVLLTSSVSAQILTIHQINVQQGDCTLIVGPDGTTFLNRRRECRQRHGRSRAIPTERRNRSA